MPEIAYTRRPKFIYNRRMTETIYRTRANEVGQQLIDSIKSLYGEKEIEITVTEQEDETEYLLKSPANREFLLQAKERIESGIGLVTPNKEQFG